MSIKKWGDATPEFENHFSETREEVSENESEGESEGEVFNIDELNEEEPAPATNEDIETAFDLIKGFDVGQSLLASLYSSANPDKYLAYNDLKKDSLVVKKLAELNARYKFKLSPEFVVFSSLGMTAVFTAIAAHADKKAIDNSKKNKNDKENGGQNNTNTTETQAQDKAKGENG